jgi:hypothetical protein
VKTHCNVRFARYALGYDAEGRKCLRWYYETEVREVLFARQPKRGGGGGGYVAVIMSEAREKTPLDREREYQQNVYGNLRNSGLMIVPKLVGMMVRSAERGEERGGLMVSCARATRGIRMPSLDARRGRPCRPPPVGRNGQAWKDY